jgi:aminopeptidase Y
VDFVLERAKTRFAKEMDTWIQPFNHTFEQTRRITVKGPEGESVYVITLLYNPSTPVPDGYTAPLIDTPVDDARGRVRYSLNEVIMSAEKARLWLF